MTQSLHALAYELQILSRAVEQFDPRAAATPNPWGIRVNLLHDLGTLLSAIVDHPDVDALHHQAAVTSRAAVRARLTTTCWLHHRSLQSGRRHRGPKYHLAHLCLTDHGVQQRACGTFSHLQAAMAATAHPDRRHWIAAPNDPSLLVLDPDRRPAWSPSSPSRIRVSPIALPVEPLAANATASADRGASHTPRLHCAHLRFTYVGDRM